jgi:hypothetical protein
MPDAGQSQTSRLPLLGVQLPDPAVGISPRRTGAWLAVHLGAGSLMSSLTLAVPPFIVVLVTSSVFPPLGLPTATPLYRRFGVGEPWAPLSGLALALAGVYLAAVLGAALARLARLAPTLLGPSLRNVWSSPSGRSSSSPSPIGSPASSTTPLGTR